jgi:hypothetical protein
MSLWDSARFRSRSPYSHPWLAELLFAFDAKYLRSAAVVEYTDDPSCIFRLEVSPSHRDVSLRDGVKVRRGDRIARLHFWNEQIPPVPAGGTTIRWARQMQKSLEASLCDLADYLTAHPELADVSVICADVPSGTAAERDKIAHIMGYYGFELIPEDEQLPLRERLHRLGDNILISLRVFAQNAAALRLDTLARVRLPVYLSRDSLVRKFGDREGNALISVDA